MSDLMTLLYEYTQSHRAAGFVDCRVYNEIERIEEKNLAALKGHLSGEGRAAGWISKEPGLVRWRRQNLDLEAMFLAALSVARELLV